MSAIIEEVKTSVRNSGIVACLWQLKPLEKPWLFNIAEYRHDVLFQVLVVNLTLLKFEKN